MSDNLNHAAVSLPPASFDIQKLRDGLDDAAKVSDDKRDAAVEKALKSARSGLDPAVIDMAARPDQKRVEQAREDLGVTENVLVHDAKSDAAADAAERGTVVAAAPAADTKE